MNSSSVKLLDLRGQVILLVSMSVLLFSQFATAQGSWMYLKDQFTSPAYEGWWPNEDGSYKLFFGDMNTNWEQHYDVPIGPGNYFNIVEAGALDDLEINAFDFAEADQGQPSHFYPRRNPFLFTIDVPADFGTREVVWTLITRGQTIRAFGSLQSDYRINPQVISTEVGGSYGSLDDRLRTNIPPELRVEGENFRTVRVGQPLSLAVRANDPDNLPEPRNRGLPTTLDALYRPPSSVVAASVPGLRFSWIVYRGPANSANFDPIQMKTYMDTRMYSNSPWSPPWYLPAPPADNRWASEVVFDAPGEYMLRGVASDGSMFTYQNLNVTVTP